eukprot:272289-Pleurochrysis_carterae.AAC.2
MGRSGAGGGRGRRACREKAVGRDVRRAGKEGAGKARAVAARDGERANEERLQSKGNGTKEMGELMWRRIE